MTGVSVRPPFRLSEHAIDRALDMGLDGPEIMAAFTSPRSVTPAGDGADYYTRGKITLVIVHAVWGEEVVKTILWARASDWAADKEVGGYDRAFNSLDGARRWRKAIKKRKQR